MLLNNIILIDMFHMVMIINEKAINNNPDRGGEYIAKY